MNPIMMEKLKSLSNASTHCHSLSESELERQSEKINEPYIKKVLVTPDLANQFLLNHEANIKTNPNEINRETKKDRVELYSREMLSGRWKENTYEPLQITKRGRITNGMHRVTAIKNSGVSIYFHIVFNALDDVFDVIDTGFKRNTGDVFEIALIKNSKGLPSIIQNFYVYINGKGAITQTVKMTNSEILNEYKKNEDSWQEIFKIAAGWYDKFAHVLAQSVIGGMYAYLISIDEDAAFSFMSQLCTGSDISNNTIALLRTKLIQDKLAVKKMPQTLKIALIIKAWNNFRTNNESLKLLKYDLERESFPKAI